MVDAANASNLAITVYSRAGCHLCEVLLEQLIPLVRGRIPVEVIDIDLQPDYREAYDTRVPVVEYNAELVCQYHLDVRQIESILREHRSSSSF